MFFSTVFFFKTHLAREAKTYRWASSYREESRVFKSRSPGLGLGNNGGDVNFTDEYKETNFYIFCFWKTYLARKNATYMEESLGSSDQFVEITGVGWDRSGGSIYYVRIFIKHLKKSSSPRPIGQKCCNLCGGILKHWYLTNFDISQYKSNVQHKK